MHNRFEYTSRTFRKLLNNNGYKYIRSRGDHDIFYREEDKTSISIPASRMNAMLALRLIKENCLREG